MSRPCDWKSAAESYSNLVSEVRRPLATLQILGQGVNPIPCRQPKEKNEPDKENSRKVPIKCENVHFRFYKHLIKDFQKHEISKQDTKLVSDDKKVQSDFIHGDANLNTNLALVNDVYFYMKKAESENCPLFRKSEGEISIRMRSSFVDWFIYTTETFELETETLHLAVHYADKYLSTQEASVSDLLLVGTCAILLACKHEELQNRIPEMDDLIKHTSCTFFKQDILKMEKRIISTLNFKMSYQTAYQFLQIFCVMYNVKGEESFLAQYICDIALIHEEIYFYTEPSKIAAASLILSYSLLDIRSVLGDVEALSGFAQNDLRCTARLLFAKFAEIYTTELKAVRAKYGSLKYKNVSKKPYPRVLQI